MKPKYWVSLALTLVTLFAGYQQYTYTSYLVSQHLPDKLISETNIIALEIEPFVRRFSQSESQPLPAVTHTGLDYALSIGSNLDTPINLRTLKSMPMGDAPIWFSKLFTTENLSYSHRFYVDNVKKGTLSTQLSPSPFIDNAWWFFCLLIFGYVCVMFISIQALNKQEYRHKAMISRFTAGIKAVEKGSFKLIKQMRQDGLFKELVIDFNQLVSSLEQKNSANLREQKLLSYATRYDELTGLPNKQQFKETMAKLLDKTQACGHLMMLRLMSLEQVNQELGFKEGDAYIRKVTNLLVSNYALKSGCNQIFRLNGRDLMIILPEVNTIRKDMWAEELKGALVELDNSLYRQGSACFTIIEYNEESVIDSLLVKLDSGLSQAMLKSANSYALIDNDQFSQPALNKWFDIVINIIRLQSITLKKQQLKHRLDNPKLYNFELFAAFECEGEKYSAHDIFAAANRFSLSSKLDKVIIEKALALGKDNAFTSARYLVSLSYDSVIEQDFCQWLSYRLKNEPKISRQLVFKLPERAVINQFESVRRCIDTLHSVQTLVCLDYEGSQYSHQLSRSIGELNIDMIKVNGHYTHRVDSYGERASFVSSLVAAAHSINIPVIASQVEQDAEWDSLVELGVDAAQGNLFGHVRPL